MNFAEKFLLAFFSTSGFILYILNFIIRFNIIILTTTTFIKVGGEGISPLLSTSSSESADLDLSYNITSTATAAVTGVGSTKPEVPPSAILVPLVGIGGGSAGRGGGGESSSSLLSWSRVLVTTVEEVAVVEETVP